MHNMLFKFAVDVQIYCFYYLYNITCVHLKIIYVLKKIEFYSYNIQNVYFGLVNILTIF